MDYYNDIPRYDYSDAMVSSNILGLILGILGTIFLFVGVFLLFSIIYNWKIYKKAGKNGWESIIPIYNLVVKFEFLNIPMWFLLLLIIPAANMALPIIIGINMAKKFGKDGGFAVGLILLPIVFYPILAFGDAIYHPEIPGIFDDINTFSDAKGSYCTNCGTKMTGKFCSNCGKSNEE